MLTQLRSLGSVLKDIPQFFVQVSNFDMNCLSFALTSHIFTLSTTRKIGFRSNLALMMFWSKVPVLDTDDVKQKTSLVFFIFC